MQERTDALGMLNRLFLVEKGIATLNTDPSWMHAGNVATLLLEVFSETLVSRPPQEMKSLAEHLGHVPKRVTSACSQLGVDAFRSS